MQIIELGSTANDDSEKRKEAEKLIDDSLARKAVKVAVSHLSELTKAGYALSPEQLEELEEVIETQRDRIEAARNAS